MSHWSMSNERAFLENLLCSRFNFFLVFFSLVIVGAIQTSDPTHLKIVLSLGALISILLALTIARAQWKLDIALDELSKLEGHPVKELKDQIKDQKMRKNVKSPLRFLGRIPIIGSILTGSMRQLIGYWIPLSCCLILIIGAIMALCGGLRPAG